MRRLISFLIAVFLLVVLCSCELSYQALATGKMHILVYGNDYYYLGHNPSAVRFEDGSKYDGVAKKLNGTVSDAVEVGKALCALAEKAGYEDSVDVTYLTDYDHTNLASFKTAISSISADSSSNDITILFFSCHGLYLRGKGTRVDYGTDITDETFIVFRNDEYPYENVLYPISKALSLIGAINGTKVIISDFCYSGAFVQPDFFSVTFGEYKEMDTATLFSKYRNGIDIDSSMYCLSAARYYEESNEPGNGDHGYFTSALLKGLGWDESAQRILSPPVEKNGKITLSELAKYVTAHDSEPSGKSQTPMVSGGSNDIVLFSF